MVRAKREPDGEERMSSIEAARYLGCSVSGLNYRGISGRLGEITVENGRKRYLRSALDAFVAKYGRSNVKRRVVPAAEEEAARAAAGRFVRRAKEMLDGVSKTLDTELRETFESYPYDTIRLAELIRSHIHLSRRKPFASSGFVGTFLSCEFTELYDKKS